MTSAKTLPHPSDLQPTQALLCVDFYSEHDDSFACVVHTGAPCEGMQFNLPAMLLPMLVHKYGEPDEFIGRTFLVERGATKTDYTRVHKAAYAITDNAHDTPEVEGKVALSVKVVGELFTALADSIKPEQL